MRIDLTPMECVVALKHLADKPSADALFLKIARAYHGGDEKMSKAEAAALLREQVPAFRAMQQGD